MIFYLTTKVNIDNFDRLENIFKTILKIQNFI